MFGLSIKTYLLLFILITASSIGIFVKYTMDENTRLSMKASEYKSTIDTMQYLAEKAIETDVIRENVEQDFATILEKNNELSKRLGTRKFYSSSEAELTSIINSESNKLLLELKRATSRKDALPKTTNSVPSNDSRNEVSRSK